MMCLQQCHACAHQCTPQFDDCMRNLLSSQHGDLLGASVLAAFGEAVLGLWLCINDGTHESWQHWLPLEVCGHLTGRACCLSAACPQQQPCLMKTACLRACAS
jgi:hypothetical protein